MIKPLVLLKSSKLHHSYSSRTIFVTQKYQLFHIFKHLSTNQHQIHSCTLHRSIQCSNASSANANIQVILPIATFVFVLLVQIMKHVVQNDIKTVLIFRLEIILLLIRQLFNRQQRHFKTPITNNAHHIFYHLRPVSADSFNCSKNIHFSIQNHLFNACIGCTVYPGTTSPITVIPNCLHP